MKKKYTIPIVLILVLSFYISAPVKSELGVTTEIQDYSAEIKSNNDTYFNTTLIIKNNTNFHEKSIKHNWSGNGTEDEPYIISSYHFNMDKTQTAIFIENTNVHFIIKKCNITNSSCGIVLSEVENGIIQDNKFYNDNCGVRLSNSDNNLVEKNEFKKIKSSAIHIDGNSYSNEFHNNNMMRAGFYFKGEKKTYTSQIITEDNTVNDKPVLYSKSKNFENKSIIGEYGQVIISDCSYARILNININNTNIGISISYSSNILLKDLNTKQNSQSGIQVINSDNLEIKNVNSSLNQHGVYLRNVKTSVISKNEILNNRDRGISLIYSSDNILKNNRITQNGGNGVDVFSSNQNIIKNNQISNNNNNGINLHTFTEPEIGPLNSSDYSSNNTILYNMIKENQGYGVKLSGYSENNRIYLNSFVHNQGSNETYLETTIQAFEEKINETADNSWNSEDNLGNYWIDWTSADENDDSIVDKPYQIDGDGNEDDYPLTNYLSSVSRFTAIPGKKDIKLNWNNPTYSIIYSLSQYRLYKGVGKENLSLYKSFNSTTHTYFDSNVSSDKTYFYRLDVENSEGHISSSNIISSSPDNISPEVISHSPTGEEIKINSNITIEFSELMQKNTVELALSENNQNVNGTIHWNLRTLTFNPEKNLDYKTSYTVIVNGKDRAGNNISTYEWTFKTEVVTAIKGRIVSSKGKPIQGALIKTDTGKNTTTNSDGEFKILVKPGKRMLTIEKEGYENTRMNIEVGSEGPKNLEDINIKDSNSGGTSWFVPLAIFGITTTILAIIAVIAFFKEQEEMEKNIQDEEEFYKDLYEEEFEEVSKEEFESWWEEKD